jgi:long-chain fatty acid transport protein
MSLAGRIAVFAFVALFAATPALAGGFQLNEHGARAMAQAGAFAARATDGSAMFFNPAGLGFQKNASIYLGTTLVIPSTSFYGPLELGTNQETKLNSQVFTPINAYVTYPIMDGLVAGIGVNNPYGLGTEWPETWAGRYITTKIDLVTFFYNATVSYRLLDNLSIGAGFNFVTGDVTIQRAVPVTSVSVPSDPRVNLSLSGTGLGFTAGLMYKLGDDWSIGASYRHPVKVEASGDATFSPNYAVLALPQGKASAALTLPSTGFFGIAYKAMDNFDLEADFQFIGWSSYDSLMIEFKDATTPDKATSVSHKKYQDTWMIRVGGEYRIGDLALRAGYYFDHSPVKDEYVEPLLPDANRHGLNIGAGYKFTDHISADVAWLFIKFLDREVTNSVVENSFNGTYKSIANLIALNLGYTF